MKSYELTQFHIPLCHFWAGGRRVRSEDDPGKKKQVVERYF